MISKEYNIEEFIHHIEKCGSYWELLDKAVQEATEAERYFYKYRKNAQSAGSKIYAEQVKGFINFIRYGIRPAGISTETYNLFSSICRRLIESDQDAREICCAWMRDHY